MHFHLKIIGSIYCIFLLNSCGNDGNSLNIFSIEDDKKLGQQISNYIQSPSSGIHILDTSKYSIAYTHLNKIRDYILQSGKIKHKNDFKWKLRIIRDDTSMNAFSTPGGYIYVYTGLIKYLDNEDDLAGVLAHEIAHADQRHSTAMLTKMYGIDLLASIILGNDNDALRNISENLLSLSFSREAEEEADGLSIEYLCQSPSLYRPDGAAGFFQKLENDKKNQGRIEFLSTHPNPPNRIEKIIHKAKEMNCNYSPNNHPSYNELKNNLP